MQIPKRRSEEQRKRPPNDPYLTEEGILKLGQDIERLKKSRPKVLKELEIAREMGDFSENAAYSYAKARLRGIDARIFELGERLKQAIPIEVGSSDGAVRLGSAVTVRVNGKEKMYEVVGAQEADPSRGRLSHLSPLGKLLLGHKAGESVLLEVENRKVPYEILAVQ